MLLKMKEILTNAKPYIENKTLGCLSGETECRYDYGNGHRCVIGASFTEPQLKKLRESLCPDSSLCPNDISLVVGKELNENLLYFMPVSVDPLEISDICTLQDLHDTACYNEAIESKEVRLGRFLEFYNRMCVKYQVD